MDFLGHSGGPTLFWKSSHSVRLLGYSRNYFDVEVRLDNSGPWHLTSVYGMPERTRRRESKDMLRKLTSRNALP